MAAGRWQAAAAAAATSEAAAAAAVLMTTAKRALALARTIVDTDRITMHVGVPVSCNSKPKEDGIQV